jgi:aminoglycoside/choline kinase family phosphotransferase
VPDLIAYHRASGVLLLEDLGDVLLSDLVTPSGEFPVRQYRASLELLARFQSERPAPDTPAPILFRRRYGAELWRWELEHFREYAVEARGARPLAPAVRDRLSEQFDRFAAAAAHLPRVPVHRDYHSRNLMIDPAGELRWIDFQDALLGPALYDVASLLYDAYVEIPDRTRDELFDDYVAAAGRHAVDLGDPDPHLTLAELAAHRMLKAAGRFIYFRDVKRLPGYEQHVPTLLRRTRALLTRPETVKSPLRLVLAILAEDVPEWAGIEA